MATVALCESKDPHVLYPHIIGQLDVQLSLESAWIPNLANAASLLGLLLPEINWAGFYLFDGTDTLILGPFHGKPAVTRIPLGDGVCGTAAKKRETQVVPDVHAFPGHISCDLASNSEIVIPFYAGDRLLGVLDIDSPKLARFDETDAAYLTQFLETLVEKTNFPG